MPKYYRDLVPHLYSYSGGTAAACGTTSTAITIPSGANCAIIHAEGGAVYWNVNGASAATTSPGYAAQDQNGAVLEIDNLSTLYVIGSGTAAVAHIEFYQS